MPRLRPRGVLERSPLADIFKNTLSRIPTHYGKLSYLASLRDANTGAYRHHGLSATFGREQSARALQESHEKVFEDWQALGLQDKHRDLTECFESEEAPIATIARHWLHSQLYLTLVPDNASPAQREHYTHETSVLLEALSSVSAGAPDRGSSRHP